VRLRAPPAAARALEQQGRHHARRRAAAVEAGEVVAEVGHRQRVEVAHERRRARGDRVAVTFTRAAIDDARDVVDGRSRTLYLFQKDKNGKSACSGACATNWPPLLTKGKPKAIGGVKPSLLGTTKRSNGTTQVTYNKHPLYTFVLDKNKPGSTKGEGVDAFGAEWYVLGTNGKKIEKKGS